MEGQMNKRAKAALIRRIERVKQQIAAKRDELRMIVEDAEAVLESCDRADDGLQSAVDALSEYL